MHHVHIFVTCHALSTQIVDNLKIFFLTKDLNECKKYENLCGENAQCRNTIGSYGCVPKLPHDGELRTKGLTFSLTLNAACYPLSSSELYDYWSDNSW